MSITYSLFGENLLQLIEVNRFLEIRERQEELQYLEYEYRDLLVP